jgi:hypothetical protein
LIEVIRHVFACQVGDNPDTVQRHTMGSRAFRHPAGFHFHYARSASTQTALLFRGLGDVIDGAHHTFVMLPLAVGLQRREHARSGRNCGTYDYVGDGEFWRQSTAEAGADDGVGGRVLQGDVNGCGGSLGAGSVGRQHQKVGAEPGGARPIDR